MESPKLHFFILFLVSFIICNSLADARKFKIPQQYNDYGITKLFVFGDSYVDTGNLHFMWQEQPYGETMGKPRGRYSDGLILTDYLAKFLGLKSPPPYHWRHNLKQELHYGMNFAYGGAGVFPTLNPRPTISTQIDMFEKLLNDSVYSSYDVESAIFLVTLAGNDYVAFIEEGHGIPDLLNFFPNLLGNFTVSLERLSKLGARRVAVGSLEPVGCLPYFTGPDYTECNSTGDLLVGFHNDFLAEKLRDLNDKRLTTSFTLLDLNGTFADAIYSKQDVSGNLKFPDPLRPCCMGSCGDVDAKGQRLYEVCDDPKSSFFWDSVHPTQSGWEAVFEALIPTIKNISSFIA